MNAPSASPLPLPLAAPGKPMTVTAICAGKGLGGRLAGMGLTPGCEVRVLQHEGAGLLVAIGGTRLALGLGMAQKILVTPA